MTDRDQAIKDMLNENPDDVFLLYSLAMEYASTKNWDEAIANFKRCLEVEQNYLAAYVEAGKCLRSAGRLDQAREMLTEAMDLAANQGENHVRDYVQQQLEALGR